MDATLNQRDMYRAELKALEAKDYALATYYAELRIEAEAKALDEAPRMKPQRARVVQTPERVREMLERKTAAGRKKAIKMWEVYG